MAFWDQISPDLRTAIIDALIVGVGLIGTWLASRITRIKEHAKLQEVINANNAKHQSDMDALKADAERAQLDNQTYIRDSAAAMSTRLDDMSKDLQKAQKDLATAQTALQTAREQFAHDSGMMEGKIQTLQEQNVDFLARLSQKDVQIADLAKQVTDLKTQNDEKQNALQLATAQKADSDTENARLHTEVTRLEKEVVALQQDAQQLKARVKELEDANKRPTGTGDTPQGPVATLHTPEVTVTITPPQASEKGGA